MPGAEGQSLLRLLTNPTASWRSEFLIEHLGEPTSPTYCGVRSTGFTYVQYGTGEEELYDILADLRTHVVWGGSENGARMQHLLAIDCPFEAATGPPILLGFARSR